MNNLVLLSLGLSLCFLFACGKKTKPNASEEIVKQYFEHYNKHDYTALNNLLTSDAKLYENVYPTTRDTFNMLLTYEKDIHSNTRIIELKTKGDTIITLEEMKDDLDPLLKKPSAQYQKKFLVKDGKINTLINNTHEEQKWLKPSTEAISGLYNWVAKNKNSETTLKLLEHPYKNGALMVSLAKEYANSSK